MTDPVRHRDTVDGRFETAAKAALDPSTSVTESLHDSELSRAARALVAQLGQGDVEFLSARSFEAYERLSEVLLNP